MRNNYPKSTTTSTDSNKADGGGKGGTRAPALEKEEIAGQVNQWSKVEKRGTAAPATMAATAQPAQRPPGRRYPTNHFRRIPPQKSHPPAFFPQRGKTMEIGSRKTTPSAGPLLGWNRTVGSPSDSS